MRIEQAQARAVGQRCRESVGGRVFAYHGARQAHGPGDAELRLSTGLPTPHLHRPGFSAPASHSDAVRGKARSRRGANGGPGIGGRLRSLA